ncbi:hypothetical protein BB561_002187 [Smittium simulii]|uniref:Ribosomal protein S6 n=1 Tax=Smittium simulii TaxID=133385 RepID=A0A2T9YRB6_9FUNG|nr:hypothetical protein BB561_002187 [Smittium simulii]
MPLYEILSISKAGLHKIIMGDLLKQTATKVLDQGGAVRGFMRMSNDQPLPYKIRKDKIWQTNGMYWAFHFYSNPTVANNLLIEMRKDDRVLRANLVKVGDKLNDYIKLKDKTIMPSV